MIDKDLAARLKSYRNFKHLTQKEVAKYLKVPHSAISDIENGKREEAENPPDDLTEELMIYDLNSIAMDFSKQDLRYDDPNFFDEIERRRKKQLESFFKFGSDSDLDYGDPMITHELARRFRERLENGEISRKELKRLLGMN